MSRAAASLALMAVLGGCALQPAVEARWDDEGDRRAHREALAEWCAQVGPCEAGRGGLMPLAPLPLYTDECGYLPPVYGDDC